MRTKLRIAIPRTDPFGALSALVMAAVVLALAAVLLVTAGPARAAFPGKNGKITFMSDRDDGNEEIHAMNPDGSAQINSTRNAAIDSDPSFSPDGKKITFESDRDDNSDLRGGTVEEFRAR